MKRSAFTTLSDVAKEAGVTAMSVSVVLNGSRSSTRVSDAARARIREAAAKLDYRPNAVARGLSRRRMDTIGVVAIIGNGNEVNYYFLDVLNGILEGAAKHGQNTTVFAVPNWDEDKDRFLKFCDGRLDGIIIIGPWLSPAFVDWIAKQISVVMIHANGTNFSAPYLTIDEEGGVYEITKHLIDQGHTDIVHFTGPLLSLGGGLRYNGYCRAMGEAGLAVGQSHVYPGGFSINAGQGMARALLANLKTRPLPTAIVCASDAIAYGSLEVLAEAGVRVPEDVSVVGFDDTLYARATQPTLTTVRQPFRAISYRAVEIVLNQVHEKLGTSDREREFNPEPAPRGAPHGNEERFDVEIVERNSVGPPRGTI